MLGWYRERNFYLRTTLCRTLSRGTRSARNVRLRTQRCSSRREEQAGSIWALVLAFATGNAGGITRDLLIGVVPPAAIRDWRYPGVCLLAGLVTFLWYPHIDMQRSAYTLAVVCDERVIDKYRVHPAQQSSEYMQRALPFRTRFGTLCSLWLAKSEIFGNGALIRNGETSGS
jgi:hypothetical protein